MILLRRPLLVYDLDAACAAALLALLAGAYFGLLAPMQHGAVQERRELELRDTTEVQLRLAQQRLFAARGELEVLRRQVDERLAQVSAPADLPAVLERLNRTAAECGVQISQVQPRPVQSAGKYLFTDLEIAGRGSAISFVRLLARLSRELPHHDLLQFQITPHAAGAEPSAQLNWTLRLFLLAAPPMAPKGPA